MNEIVKKLFPRGYVTEESRAQELAVLEQEVGTVTTETLRLAISKNGSSKRDINLLLKLHIKQCGFSGRRCCKIGTVDGKSPDESRDTCKIYNQIPSRKDRWKEGMLSEPTECPIGIALNMLIEAARKEKNN
mmetsp:Transcript_16067/g.22553  ORF Transcript_16067/g.22553 Transcript_16067/m.22553 type:complete len:132 (+) Transcript_16067:3-398(+)